MKVHEALAKAFVAEGTSAVFGVMGDANHHWLESIVKLGVTNYKVRHEGPGVAMAEAWAQINGAPGVCTTTCGPGTAHIGTQMIVAARNRTPLVAFCGDTSWGGDGGNQQMNHERFAAGIEAGFVRVKTAERSFDAVQEAFYLARLESRPVMLSAPADIQEMAFDDLEIYEPSSGLLKNKSIYPNPASVNEAAVYIAQSDRVVIIVGRGALRAGAERAITKLADRTGALIATSLMAMNSLRDDTEYHAGISGLYATRPAMELFQEAECVIAIGTSLSVQTTEHGYLYPSAKYVQIDTRSQVITGEGRSADYYIQADARQGVEVLDAALEKLQVKKIGYRTSETAERLKVALYDPVVYEIAPEMLDPREVCRVLDEMLPSDIGVSLGGGHQVTFGTMLFTRARPVTVVNTEFGSMGKALMGAIGAVIASGYRPAVALEGDAGLMMHVQEFETAVRYNVPVLVVVLNDQALGSELHKGNSKGIDPELAQISTPDLGMVGIAFGGRGARPRTIEEFREAVAQFVANPAPTILDVRIPQSVVSVPYRRLYFGEHDV